MTTTTAPVISSAPATQRDSHLGAIIFVGLGLLILAGYVVSVLAVSAHDAHLNRQVLAAVHAKYGASVINTDELNYYSGHTTDNLIVRLPGGHLARCEAAYGTGSASDVTLLCGTNRVEPPRR